MFRTSLHATQNYNFCISSGLVFFLYSLDGFILIQGTTVRVLRYTPGHSVLVVNIRFYYINDGLSIERNLDFTQVPLTGLVIHYFWPSNQIALRRKFL